MVKNVVKKSDGRGRDEILDAEYTIHNSLLGNCRDFDFAGFVKNKPKYCKKFFGKFSCKPCWVGRRRMNRKGIALKYVVDLIIIAVFLVLLIVGLIMSHLFDKLIVYASIGICTFSSIIRSVLISIVIISMSTVEAYFNFLGFASLAGISGKTAILKAISASVKGAAYAGGSIAVFMAISIAIVNIPLVCPVIHTSLGTDASPVTQDVFYKDIGSKVVSSYDMMGSGNFDPLVGLKSNPKILFVIGVNAESEVNMSGLYKSMNKTYNDSWKFGNREAPNIYLYCDKDGVKTNYGNDVSKWEDCSFSKAFIIMLYRDYYNVGIVGWFKNWYTNDLYGFDVSNGNFEKEDNVIIIVKVVK